MNTALNDLHNDLVILEDNGIIDTPDNSNHSSPRSTTDEEEEEEGEEEEDGAEDVELTEKYGDKNILTGIQPEDEIVNDGINIWIPVQLLKKNIAKFWSHFLAIDKELTKVKCKHCGEILTRNDSNLTRYFRSHLKSKHNVSANKSFYSMNFTAKDSILKNNDSHVENADKPSYNSLAFNSHSTLRHFDIGKLQSNNSFSFSQLIAIIIASEDLPLNFFENESFKFLISKFHRPPSLTPSAIKEAIVELSNSIDDLVRRSVPENGLHLPFNIHLSNPEKSDGSVYSQYLKDIRMQLHSLDLSSLVSVNFTELDKTRSLFSLQVFDNNNKVSKILPLSIIVRKTTDIDSHSWQKWLNSVYSKYPGLQKSVISLTLPKSYYAKVLEKRNSGNPSINAGNVVQVTYHICIVSELLHCFLQPFFNLPTESLLSSFSLAKEINPQGSLLDSLTDFSHLDISSTVLGKISSLIEEVNLKGSLKSDFLLYCKSYTQPNCNELASMLSFNCDSFSALKNFLGNFANLVPFFKSINSHLENESLTESDFRLIITIEETLKTFEQAIEYFASSAPLKFTHTLVFIINFEAYLTEVIQSSTFTKSKKPFEKILSRISKLREFYLLDDVNLIGAFLYPSVFQSKSLLTEIFNTTSINEIVNKVTKIASRYLRNFIDIINFQSFDNSKDNELSSGEELLPGYENIFMNESQDIRLSCNITPTSPQSKDLLFAHIIRDDLLRYIDRITHELPDAYHSYLNDNDTSFDGSHFTKFELPEESASDSGEWRLNIMEETFDIHIPISDTIWNNYINDDRKIVVIDTLLQLLSINSASSIRSEFSFLQKASEDFNNELYEETIKIKLVNSQFNLEEIDFHSRSFFHTCQ